MEVDVISPTLTIKNKKLDEKFGELAENIFHHCKKALESEAFFDIPQYPIEEIQQKRQLELQINTRSLNLPN